MPRAALYARYSSELQRAASIADQLRLLRERAARDGLEVVAEFSDAAISGSSMVARPGLQQLVAAARAGRFEIVLAEALDRLSRDQEDVAGLFKRLRHAGARIVTLAEGDVDELHIGLKGTMNALFVRDLAAKVRRGQRGRVEQGRIPGGLTYGYARVRELDAKGEIEGGRRAIDAAQAAVVRRIFADFVAGVSPRAIAAALNREGVPAPRGGHWNASTINGHRARRNGILNNELYAGRIVYNRQAFVKDPDTGRRQARPNPRAQWISVDAPELALVDAETWRQAQALKARFAAFPAHIRRRPKRLLSGLVACGVCGGGFAVIAQRMGCTARKEKGTCSNGHTIAADALERRVLDGLKERFLAPDLVATFVREVQAEAARRRAVAGEQRRQSARQLGELERRIARLVDAIADGTDTPATRQRLVEAENAKAELERQAAASAEPPAIVLHPNLPELYRRQIAELEAAIAADPASKAKAFAALRGMIDAILIHPGEARGAVKIELRGQLAGILAAMAYGTKQEGAAVSDRALASIGNGGCGRGIHSMPALPVVVFV